MYPLRCDGESGSLRKVRRHMPVASRQYEEDYVMAFKIGRKIHLRRPAEDDTVATVLIPDESAWIDPYGPMEAPGEPSHILVTQHLPTLSNNPFPWPNIHCGLHRWRFEWIFSLRSTRTCCSNTSPPGKERFAISWRW